MWRRRTFGKKSLVKGAVVVFLCLFFYPGTATADIYGFVGRDGRWHFPGIKAPSRANGAEEHSNPDKYEPVIHRASKKYGLEPSLIKAVIRAESDFDFRAVSRKGAVGLMQLMPDTAVEMEVADPFNPEENIFGGTRYLSDLLKRFGQNKALALAAYNAGPAKVEESGGIPPIEETRQYVKRVIAYYEELKHPGAGYRGSSKPKEF